VAPSRKWDQPSPAVSYFPIMNDFLRARFGDPCDLCGFAWRATDDPDGLIAAAPQRYRNLTAGATGRECAADLTWSVTAYVAHAADNTHIWAERLAGAAFGALAPIAPYDEDALAEARSYNLIELPAALWSLQRAVGDWEAAYALSGPGFVHPQQGELSPDHARAIVAHELHHHAFDVARSLTPSK
jgi:hypothetical protein